MRASRRVPPFAVVPRPSRRWLAAALALHGFWLFAVLAVWPQGWPSLLPLPASLYWTLRADGWLPGARRVARLEVGPRGELTVVVAGRAFAARLAPDTVVWPWLIALRLDSEVGPLGLMLLPDSADPEALRALAVYARWFADPPDSLPIQDTHD
ncbi:hypothetical protein EV683_1109 [Crenobacter luteus]|uniref:protein YgfX n=1 Tax=Crenobacter luteus TaxID=1452487 RepID=UPI00104468B2|nr:protein YgfX [Crenobacter luteus]TCP12087.1 hypothetical protein EV683_1109 [Crenobacter luteus]